jgi:hypothetical protein
MLDGSYSLYFKIPPTPPTLQSNSGYGGHGKRHGSIYRSTVGLFDNAFVEFLATIMSLYSCIYVPHIPNDSIAQFYPALAIITIYMTLKDHSYFPPDGSIMVTFILLCGGAYTDKNDGTKLDQLAKTRWADVFVRFFGQILAFVLVYTMVVVPNAAELTGTVMEQNLASNVVYTNEFLATVIEGIGVAFCIMPLLKPFDDIEDKTDKYADVRDGQDNGRKEADKWDLDTFPSKAETRAPSTNHLFMMSLSVAILHIVLERLFSSTMNPFVYAMHCDIQATHSSASSHACDSGKFWSVCFTQLGGLLVAGLYCYLYIPDHRVFRVIFNYR